jgi:hypothetical protein
MIIDKMCRVAISRVSREIRKRSLALTTQRKAGMSIFPKGMRFLLAILLLPLGRRHKPNMTWSSKVEK